MGAQSFYFAPKFSQTGGLQPQILHFLDENFRTRSFPVFFPTDHFFGGGAAVPLFCHDTTRVAKLPQFSE